MSNFEREPEQKAIDVSKDLLPKLDEASYPDVLDQYIEDLDSEYIDFLVMKKIREMSLAIFTSQDRADVDNLSYENAVAFYEGSLLAMDAMHRAMGDYLLGEWDQLETDEYYGRSESIFALGDLYDSEELEIEDVIEFSEEGRRYISDTTMDYVKSLSDKSSIAPEAKYRMKEGFNFVVHRAVEALKSVAPELAPTPKYASIYDMDVDSSAYLSEVVDGRDILEKQPDAWDNNWDDVVAKLLYGYGGK